MRAIPAAVQTALQNKDLTGLKPTWQITAVKDGTSYDLDKVRSIRIDRRDGQLAAKATIVLDNQDGRYAPDKAGSAYQGVLFPGVGTKVTIQQGYGSDLVTTFTGYIDSIGMGRDPRHAEVIVYLRDRMKLLTDQRLIISGSDKGSLTGTTPEAAFSTACQACGFAPGEIQTVATSITDANFNYDRDSGDTFVGRIATTFGLRAYADEDGNAVLGDYPQESAADIVYEEGGDASRFGRIFRLPAYEITDQAIYKTLKLYAADAAGASIESTYAYVGDITLPDNKLLEYVVDGAKLTQAQLDATASRLGRQMAQRLRKVRWRGPALPWHQLMDVCQVIESSTTISELYTVVGLMIEQDPHRFEMELEGVHFGPA